MKILYFSTAIIPSKYANSVNVMKMCSALTECGNDVTLIAQSGSQEDPFSFYSTNKQFRIIKTKNGFLSKLSRLFLIFRETKYDLIYTRYPLAAFIYGCILKKKVVYEYHQYLSGINAFFEKRIANRKNIAHVFITKALEKDYLERHDVLSHRKIIVLPDGADSKEVPDFSYLKKTCGYVGSFQKGKGVEIVLKLARRLPSVIFHIVGGSPSEIDYYKGQYPEENIIWHGQQPPKQAMDILSKDIGIALLPNQNSVFVGKKGETDIGKYTSPIKLFEYMSYGKAIIASDLPVLKEIIEHNRNAYLVDPGNIDEWVNAVEHLLNDEEVMQTLKQNAYNDFINNYSWKSRAEKLISFLANDKGELK